MKKVFALILLFILFLLGFIFILQTKEYPSDSTQTNNTISVTQQSTTSKQQKLTTPTPIPVQKESKPSLHDSHYIDPFSPYTGDDKAAYIPIKGVLPQAVFMTDFHAIKALGKGDRLFIPSLDGDDPTEIVIINIRTGVANTKIYDAVLETDSQQSERDFSLIVAGESSLMITLKKGQQEWMGIINENGIGRFYDKSAIDAKQRYDRPDTRDIPKGNRENF